MSEKQPDTITYHAMLVAWGQFGQSIGLIRAIEAVVLRQKKVEHSPQTKILEFFVAILAGLKHLQELSHSAHPIDQDPAVAKAWLQAGWADSSGVSRTLTGVSQVEAEQIVKVLDQITRPILWVIWQDQGCLLKFTDQSLYAGRSLSLNLHWAVQLPLPFAQNAAF